MVRQILIQEEQLIPNANSDTYDAPATATGNKFYYAVLTNANGTTVTGTIRVRTNPCPPSITSITATQPTPCVGAATSLKVTATSTSAEPFTYKWFSSADNVTWIEITGATTDTYAPSTATAGTMYYYAKVTNASDSATSNPVSVSVSNTGDCTTANCTKPSTATGTPTGTKTGISIQQNRDTWPEDIPNGWLALEAKTKGFVITRVADDTLISEPKEGMLIYDESAKCVKLYDGTKWGCLEKNCD